MKWKGGVQDGDGWETLSREAHFTNSHVDLVTEEVRTPGKSKPRKWTVAHRKIAVVIAPMTRERNLILIQQERIPIRRKIWEVPAGQIDGIVDPTPAEIEAVALRAGSCGITSSSANGRYPSLEIFHS